MVDIDGILSTILDLKKNEGEKTKGVLINHLIKQVNNLHSEYSDSIQEYQDVSDEAVRKHSTLIDAIPDFIFRMDNKGIYLDHKSNDSYKGQFEKKFIGKSLDDLDISLKAKVRLAGAIKKAITKQQIQTIEFQLLDENKEFYVECRVVAGKEEEEVICMLRDITVKKKSEILLNETHNRLFLATNAAKIGIWEWNVNDDNWIWDNSLYELFQVQMGNDLEPLRILEKIIEKKGLSRFYMILEEAKIMGEDFHIQFQIHRSNGEMRDISCNFQVYRNRRGAATKMIGVCWDVTNQIRISKLKKESELAIKESNFKDQFLANMSHEIRTPLNGIIEMLDVYTSSNEFNEEQVEQVDIIQGSANSLLQIINDILDLSKLQAGKMTINHFDLKLEDHINRALILFKPKADEKNLTLKLNIAKNVPELVSVDGTRVNQILNNLISNAIKFTVDGGVSVNITKSNLLNNNIELKFEIKDTGLGIPDKDISKVFEKFSQVEEHNDRRKDGTGLGLPICKQLAELMGGKVGVESIERQGSNFWFTIVGKVAKKSSVANKEINKYFEEFKPIKPLNILVVEDKIVNQKVVKLMLMKHKHIVEIANDGQEAVDIFKPGKFDLILMDIQMPVMDGITATTILKKKYQSHELPPIIGLSANSMEGDAEKYIDKGLDDYLSKPLTINVLFNKLNNLGF